MAPTERRSALGLVVLAALFEEPMHAYRIHALIKARGKDRVVNVRGRASVYQAIDRLQALGLIAVLVSGRVDRRPERTVYEITDLGRETAIRWVREMLVETGHEFPEFLVGLASLTGLAPDDARRLLARRADALQATVDELDATLAQYPDLPRVFTLEEELRRATLRAELDWVRGVVDDLRAGRLTWDNEWLAAIAEKYAHVIDNREEHPR